MDDIKVSIIVPTYNIQEFICRCLESILVQTYRNLEIIAVDDGSEDETPIVLKEIAKQDDRITVICKENGGVTSARLRGVAEATGDYIGFVDGDDYIEPEMFRCLVENAINYKADISHCGYKMVFHNREDLYYGTGRLVLQNCKMGLKDLLSGTYVEPGLCNKLFHRSLFENLLKDDLMDKSIKNNEDLLMNFYLFRESRLSVFEDFCPYHYIVRANSAANMTLNIHQLLDPIKVTKIILEHTKDEMEIYGVVRQKYIRQLISLATKDLKVNPQLVSFHRGEARNELRHMALEVLQSSQYTPKLKIMTIWASISPTSYQWIHAMYAKFSGIDKIYDLE